LSGNDAERRRRAGKLAGSKGAIVIQRVFGAISRWWSGDTRIEPDPEELSQVAAQVPAPRVAVLQPDHALAAAASAPPAAPAPAPHVQASVDDDEDDTVGPDEAAWDELLECPTRAAVEAFLQAWPASEFADAGRDLLARFQADTVDVEQDAHWSAVLAQQLLWRVHGHEADGLAEQVLIPWARELVFLRRWLQDLKDRPGAPLPPASPIERVALYWLGRVSQALLAAFQDACDECAGTARARISREEYAGFFEALGFSVLQAPAFSGVFHEIVMAHAAADAHARITVQRELWPGLTLGPMVFSRAGVEVSGGAGFLDPVLATTSMLYWAYHRCRRPCDDLAMGWGANSSFFTEARRDLVIGGRAWLQADESEELHGFGMSLDGFTRAQWEEFMLHRCFVRTKLPREPWGYDTRVVLGVQDTLGR
jgi:hypothetical protein